jgi:hypothetical protein
MAFGDFSPKINFAMLKNEGVSIIDAESHTHKPAKIPTRIAKLG